MIQIAIFLLCIYLIFKGKELVSLAQLRADSGKDKAIHNAKGWFTASLIIALVFALWAIMQGSSMPSPGI